MRAGNGLVRAGRQEHAAHEPLISSVIVAEVRLTGLHFSPVGTVHPNFLIRAMSMSVMTRCSLAALVASGVFVASASADVICNWTIPTAFPSGAGNVPTGTSYSVGVANLGAATVGTNLSSTHQLASSGANQTSYTSPAGNGSTYAFSSNVWKAGDYYEAAFSGTGYTDLSFAWDFTRSTTGPATWTVIMSVDGGSNWSTLLATFNPIINAAAPTGAGTWSTTTYNPAYTSSIALGAVADNAPSILVRVQATVDSVNSTGVYQAGGTARIDNVSVFTVPEPSTYAISAIATAGLAGFIRWRKRRSSESTV
jgi:PEP-CTERM motif